MGRRCSRPCPILSLWGSVERTDMAAEGVEGLTVAPLLLPLGHGKAGVLLSFASQRYALGRFTCPAGAVSPSYR